MPRVRRSFSDEFKASAVERIVHGRESYAAVCKDIDVAESVVRAWVKKAVKKAAKRLPAVRKSTIPEQAPAKEAQAEPQAFFANMEVQTLGSLRDENDTLVKALAILARRLPTN